MLLQLEINSINELIFTPILLQSKIYFDPKYIYGETNILLFGLFAVLLKCCAVSHGVEGKGGGNGRQTSVL